MDDTVLERFFYSEADLGALCTQNGWPDPETLEIEIIRREGPEMLCSVTFEEILMEGAGCVAGRVRCWGRFRVRLDAGGRIVDARLVAGERSDESV